MTNSSISEDFKELLPRQSTHQDSDERPFMMLWVYDPQEDRAHVEAGEAEHPADFPTHETMAEHVTHPERMQGYAYPIQDSQGRPHAWRVTDAESHRVEDPHVLKLVLAALRQEHPPPPLPHIPHHGDPLTH